MMTRVAVTLPSGFEVPTTVTVLPLVMSDVVQQIKHGNRSLVGVMIESNLVGGNQIVCSECRTICHPECLSGLGRCPTLGCKLGAKLAKRTSPAPTRIVLRGMTAGDYVAAIFVLGILAVFVGVGSTLSTLFSLA